MQKIAIIGAGLAGAVLSQRLIAAGRDVTLFEKSRGTGGRLASARLGFVNADLGAPTIDAHSHAFRAWLQQQEQVGRVVAWMPRTIDFQDNALASERVWLGEGRNSSLTRGLIAGAQLETEKRIGVVWPDAEGVLLRDTAGESLGYFDAVICTAPAPQAVPLLEAVPRFAAIADQVVTDPSWVYIAELAALPERLDSIDLVEDGHSSMARIVVESNKPGRVGVAIKVEMSSDWSERCINDSAERVQQNIREILAYWLGQSIDVLAERTHRWLYNCSYQPVFDKPALWDPGTGIGACGDWIGAVGLDGSFTSANYLADLLLETKQSAA